MKRTLTTAAVYCIHQLATAQAHQQPIEIGAVNGTKLAVSAGTENQRVGKAVLAHVQGNLTDINVVTSHTVLLACDGSWISTPVQFAAQFNKTAGFSEIERYGKSQEDEIPLDRIFFQGKDESDLDFAAILTKRAPQICKTAGHEPRNILIPVASTVDKDGTGGSMAIVLGTSAKNGNIIDLWIRTTDFKTVPKLDDQGIPITVAGKVQMHRVPVGSYSLGRGAFDCRNREFGFYHSVSYAGPNATPTSDTVQRANLRLSPAVPGSVGEVELDAICKLYD